jgi:hypothetical protein
MKKRNQLIVFVLVTALGIFLMDRFLFPMAKSCRCLDFEQAKEDCWAVCYLIGECALFYAAEHPGGCSYSSCVYKMANYCENRDTGKITISYGYLYSSYCSDCYSYPI